MGTNTRNSAEPHALVVARVMRFLGDSDPWLRTSQRAVEFAAHELLLGRPTRNVDQALTQTIGHAS